jgi:DNA-binding CsgD family transcriptional regulator
VAVAVEIIGRDDEVAALHAFLEGAGGGPSALALEGEAGIGKTTLWLAAVEAARERAHAVLSARPAEAERDLAYVALGDLLEPWLDELLPLLPAPRRRALEAALLLAADEGPPADPRALALAVHGSLRLLAERGPVVVAVDDVQWVDTPSATALGFALRRLDHEQVVALLARRSEPGVPPSELEAALPARERIAVGPLSVGAVQGLLRSSLGRPLPRPTLVRLHAVSGGNPFYALELARAVLAVAPSLDPTAPPPFPESLPALVGDRLRRLPDETRHALLVVAALGHASSPLAAAAGVTAEALAPAVESRIVEVGEEIRFTHPLLASEAYSSAAAADRREVHGLLKDLVDDPVGRARHLALSLDAPDERAATQLEEAAAAARARGAPSVSAELGEAAARATPGERGDHHHRRLLVAAQNHLAAGSAERAFSLARRLLGEAPHGRRRAEVLLLLGELEASAGSMLASVEALREARREALREAAGAPELELAIHEQLAMGTRITEGTYVAAAHGRAAVELAERLGDDALTARAVGALAVVLYNAGDAESFELARSALALAERSGDPGALDAARVAYAHCHMWGGRLDDARRVLLALLESADDREEPIAAAEARWYLAYVEQRAGRLQLARRYAERSRAASLELNPEREDDPSVLGGVVSVALLQGDDELVRELCGRALAYGEPNPMMSTVRFHHAVLGMVEHWAGAHDRALDHFAIFEEHRRAVGFAYTIGIHTADYCETLIALGRLEEARTMLVDWERDAVRLDHRRALAEIVRNRGLLASAAGELDEAAVLLERAVVDHEAAGDPFGRGRALLALGAVRRRQRQKRSARDAIEAAAAVFRDVGAVGWEGKASAELGRVGGRTQANGLTPAELRVAVLVAAGRTNKEVAAELFLGERTVETHLSHVYAKLGIRSRTELARTLR